MGNWIEVEESVQALQGEGEPDVMEVSLTLAGEMIQRAGVAESFPAGREQAKRAIESGAALQKFIEIVEAQGAKASSVLERRELQPAAEVHAPAKANGYVANIDALVVGLTACQMGVGRSVKEEEVDPLSGIVLHKKPGESVTGGCKLATLYTHNTRDVRRFIASILGAIRFSESPPEPQSLIMDRLDRQGWISDAEAS